MTSNVGDFRLFGSVSGSDGAGNLAWPFVSQSGQISLDPKFWRAGRVENNKSLPEYGAAKNDTFSFDVYRSALNKVSFKADSPAPLIEPLVKNLPNARHTLELITEGDGDVEIHNLYVYQPPETQQK